MLRDGRPEAMDSLMKYLPEDMKELLALVVILLLILMTFVGIGSLFVRDADEKKDFMVYCQGKGGSAEDCRWEYVRMVRGGRK